MQHNTPNMDLPPADPDQPPAAAPGGYDGYDDDGNVDTSLREVLRQFQAQMRDMNTRLNQGLLTGTSLNQRLNVLNKRIDEQQSRTTPDTSTVGGAPDLHYRPGDKEDDYIERQLMRTEEPLRKQVEFTYDESKSTLTNSQLILDGFTMFPMLRYLVKCCCWAEYSHGGPKPGLREAIQRMNKDMRDRIVIAKRTAARSALVSLSCLKRLIRRYEEIRIRTRVTLFKTC